MSATEVWCELVCSVCSAGIVGEWTRGAAPRKSLTDAAKKMGARIKDGNVTCRSCAIRATTEAGQP